MPKEKGYKRELHKEEKKEMLAGCRMITLINLL